MSIVGVKQLISKALSSSRESSPLGVNENSSLLNKQVNPNNYTDNNASDGNTVADVTGGSRHSDLESATESSTRDQSSKPFPLNYLSSVDPRTMSDLIIGLSDGLTVPFALTAGLSSLGDTKLVITGGLAELVSGAISMGLGGYLAAKSESEFYVSQVRKEKQIFFQNQDTITDELFDILIDMGASEETSESFINDL